MDKDNILGILTRAVQQAPVAVFVAGSDISVWLQKAGYENIEVFRIKKQHTFIRYVHRARSSLPGSRQP